MEYTLDVDRKTKLPSRLSCDERIESIKKRGALGTFTCVVLSIDNLREVNRAIGYAAGDKILKEIGDTLKALSREYGFIGSNGANQFLCLLDNCTGEKAEFMLSLLSESIKQFNEGNPGVMIEMKARIADSKKFSFLGILMLISRYRWFTDFISTVNFRSPSAISHLPKPVMLLIMLPLFSVSAHN